MALQKMVDEVAKDLGETLPEIIVSVTTGNPAEELVKASYDADMLVVGSRGSGMFAKLLIGSVSSKVTHHAASPVVVIPAAGEAARPKAEPWRPTPAPPRRLRWWRPLRLAGACGHPRTAHSGIRAVTQHFLRVTRGKRHN